MSKIMVTMVVLLMFNSCGYFENDGVRYKKSIRGNVSMMQLGNSDKVELVFAETDEVYSQIVEDCRSVYFDSVKNMIYVEGAVTGSTSSYYRIALTNLASRNVWEALKKDNVDKDTFAKLITSGASVRVELND